MVRGRASGTLAAKASTIMIEPNDDDERTTSLGLFNTAEAYRLSAIALPDVKHGHAEKPRRLLYCHALELYLKAMLRQKHSTATVRKFGHRVKLLVREAETLGLVVGDNDRAVLALIDDTDAMLDSRYIRTGRKRVATLEALCGTCKNIRDGVGTILRNNDVPVRL
jgi:hypothetical protein